MKNQDNKLDPLNELKQNHAGGLRKLLSIYFRNDRLKRIPFFGLSLVITIILIVCLACNKVPSFDFLVYVNQNILSVLPNMLGFNLGAYILLVGFNSSKILSELIEKIDEKYSLFQYKSSVFGFSVLVQAVTLIFAYITNISIGIGKSVTFYAANAVNYTCIFFIVLLGIYSVFLVIPVILNVFGFGQTLHFFATVHKLEEPNETSGD